MYNLSKERHWSFGTGCLINIGPASIPALTRCTVTVVGKLNRSDQNAGSSPRILAVSPACLLIMLHRPNWTNHSGTIESVVM